MLFKVAILKKIKEGTVSLAFRKWKKPTIKQGGTLLTPIGLLRIEGIEPVLPEDISEEYLLKSGYTYKK